MRFAVDSVTHYRVSAYQRTQWYEDNVENFKFFGIIISRNEKNVFFYRSFTFMYK